MNDTTCIQVYLSRGPGQPVIQAAHFATPQTLPVIENWIAYLRDRGRIPATVHTHTQAERRNARGSRGITHPTPKRLVISDQATPTQPPTILRLGDYLIVDSERLLVATPETFPDRYLALPDPVASTREGAHHR